MQPLPHSFATGNWTSTEALPQSLYASSSTLLGKEMVVAGGFANFGRVTDIIRFVHCFDQGLHITETFNSLESPNENVQGKAHKSASKILRQNMQ